MLSAWVAVGLYSPQELKKIFPILLCLLLNLMILFPVQFSFSFYMYGCKVRQVFIIWSLIFSNPHYRPEGGEWGTKNYEILWATMVDRRRKFFISNRLKGLEKLNIYWRRVMLISTTNRCLLRNYLESVLRVSKCLRSLEFVSFGFDLKRFSLQKLMFQLI